MKSRIKTRETVYKSCYKITKTNKGFLINTIWGNSKYYYLKDKEYPRVLLEWWKGDFFKA